MSRAVRSGVAAAGGVAPKPPLAWRRLIQAVARLTFTRHRDLSRNRMIEGLHGVKRAAAELLGFDGAYLRFSGEIRIEHYRGDEIVDQAVTEDAIWELMYLGHARSRDD